VLDQELTFALAGMLKPRYLLALSAIEYRGGSLAWAI